MGRSNQRKLLLSAMAAISVVAAGVYLAFQFSPWPSVLLVRAAFSADAEKRNQALKKHVPSGIVAQLNLRYGAEARMVLDVYRPGAAGQAVALPAVVWIHGGGFVAGDKSDVSGYLRILAGKGFATIAIGYDRAPGAAYPTPVLQASAALDFLNENAVRLGLDPQRIVIAGDSAGAQIAAQLAAAIAAPAYAERIGFKPGVSAAQIRGVVLFCGVYDASLVPSDGAFGGFIQTVLWSYFGTKRFSSFARASEFAVNRHVTAEFPPTFISVGNADPLAPQSALMADALKNQRVRAETLFFPNGHSPPLQHEYQFDLDGEAGKLALQRVVEFLNSVLGARS